MSEATISALAGQHAESTPGIDSPTHSLRSIIILVGMIVLAVLLPRMLFIELRPLHHDESVNFHFVQETFRKGYYPYSHLNYHGPLYFYMLVGFVSLLGDSVLSFRGASILSGVFACLLPALLFWKRWSVREILCVVLFLGVSASGVFHSRYAIHEILLLACSLGMASFAFRFFDEGKLLFGGGAALFAALCFATKETTLVVGFGLFLSCYLVFGIRGATRRIFELVGNGKRWIFLSGLLVIIIFSGGLQWSGGVREFALAFAQWISRGVEDHGHFKPWHYYLKVFYQTEPALLPALLLCVLGTFRHGRAFLGANWKGITFFSLFGTLLLGLHSAIPYKMPWIVVQWTGPLAVATGLFVGRLLELWSTRSTRIAARESFLRGIGAIFGVLLLAAQLGFGVEYNFRIPYGSKNPFSYVHTGPDFITVMERIKPLLKNNPNEKLLVGVNAYWPIPYYLRDYASQLGYQVTSDIGPLRKSYGVFLVEKEFGNAIPKDKCLESKYYRLSDVEETYLVVDRCKMKGDE